MQKSGERERGKESAGGGGEKNTGNCWSEFLPIQYPWKRGKGVKKKAVVKMGCSLGLIAAAGQQTCCRELEQKELKV